MKTKQALWTIAVVTVSRFLTTCKKNISLPSPELEKLFGSWEWVQSSGGFGGQTTTPTSSGDSQTVEFNKNGIYKWYKGDKLQHKMKFSVTEYQSVYTTSPSFVIKYKDTRLFVNKDFPITQTVTFGGQDSLFLNDECNDCYNHIYIRK